MPRPAPSILLEITNNSSNKIDQVLESSSIWAVFYKDKPINLKTISLNLFSLKSKYKKVSFSNAGHAFNLAKRLNKQFNCNDFSVYQLNFGKKIDDR